MVVGDSPCKTQKDVLIELKRIAPDAPFLALGQTVFWDEPMKLGLLQASQKFGVERRFVAGVHDTDYFAKLPHYGGSGFTALPHNDTTTQSLWSAAGEFSALFGSETVITREQLMHYGAKLGKIQRERPNLLNEVTEAWGWRGVVHLGDEVPVVAEMNLEEVLPALRDTLEWAVRESIKVDACAREDVKKQAERINQMVKDHSSASTLSDFYQRMLPGLTELATNEKLEFDVTSTTQLLNFNSLTSSLPRFELLNRFLNPVTRYDAVHAYNETVQDTEIYTLDRFGSWAIPFDLIIPGVGRGTIRVAPKAIVIMTPNPQFITLKRPVTDARELALAIEHKFGAGCTLVGKAVSLIGMLAREFIFVFHEGASGYVHLSRNLHQKLFANEEIQLNPILRIRYHTWKSMSVLDSWLKMPGPFCQPYGCDEIAAKSFAKRWCCGVAEQKKLLEEISNERSPLSLINWLADQKLGPWETLSKEYFKIHETLSLVAGEISNFQTERRQIIQKIKKKKVKLNEIQLAKGKHWREKVFEKSPSDVELAVRSGFDLDFSKMTKEINVLWSDWHALMSRQTEAVRLEGVVDCHRRRQAIEFEAELKRIKLVGQAITVSKGLPKAGLRPSSWWFPLFSPNGEWFRETVATADYYLEPLI